MDAELVVERVFPDFQGQGVLRLRGPLTYDNLPLFQNAVRRETTPTLILDLTEVPYIDSAGLGSLVGTYVSSHKAGQQVVLTGVNERVAKLFQITKVEPLFLTFPSLEMHSRRSLPPARHRPLLRLAMSEVLAHSNHVVATPRPVRSQVRLAQIAIACSEALKQEMLRDA